MLMVIITTIYLFGMIIGVLTIKMRRRLNSIFGSTIMLICFVSFSVLGLSSLNIEKHISIGNVIFELIITYVFTFSACWGTGSTIIYEERLDKFSINKISNSFSFSFSSYTSHLF